MEVRESDQPSSNGIATSDTTIDRKQYQKMDSGQWEQGKVGTRAKEFTRDNDPLKFRFVYLRLPTYSDSNPSAIDVYR
jgi:hypothetical protein